MTVRAKHRYETLEGTVLHVMEHDCPAKILKQISTGEPFAFYARNEFKGALPEGKLKLNRVVATKIRSIAKGYFINVELFMGDLGNNDDSYFSNKRKTR